MANIREQVKEIFQQAALKGKELKAALRDVVRDNWPDLPPWSTLPGAVVEEVQKATVGSGVVLTFSEDGAQKVVLAEAGSHYKLPAGSGAAYTIPGGFINLTETPGSTLVPASKKPEDGRTGAAREVEEELKLPDGAPLLQVEPSRLKPMDTKTLAFPNGEVRIVIGFMLELNEAEIAAVKAHVAKLASDSAYKTATAEQSLNHDSGRPEVQDVGIFTLKDAATGKVNLLHKDQQSLFEVVDAHYSALRKAAAPASAEPKGCK